MAGADGADVLISEMGLMMALLQSRSAQLFDANKDFLMTAALFDFHSFLTVGPSLKVIAKFFL